MYSCPNNLLTYTKGNYTLKYVNKKKVKREEQEEQEEQEPQRLFFSTSRLAWELVGVGAAPALQLRGGPTLANVTGALGSQRGPEPKCRTRITTPMCEHDVNQRGGARRRRHRLDWKKHLHVL